MSRRTGLPGFRILQPGSTDFDPHAERTDYDGL